MQQEGKSRKMQLTEIAKYVNDAVALRKPHEAKIEEYKERMLAGVAFPPIILIHYPHSEKYGEMAIGDGIHRFIAATRAKLEAFPTETKKFGTLEEALLYMYEANKAHGLPVSEGDRNKRIKLIRAIDPKLTLEAIGKKFELGKSSIARILDNDQGEGKSGPKGGANKNKSHKTQEALKEKAFFSLLERIDYTFNRVRPVADIVSYMVPMGKDGKSTKLDKEKFDLVKKCQEHLTNLVKQVS